MVSALVPGAIGPDSSPSRGHWGNLTNCGGTGLASRPGGVEILLAASCYRNRG